MTTEKTTITRQQVGLTKEDFSKILKVKRREKDRPLNAEDATAFWKGIWSAKVEDERSAEWIDKAKENMSSGKQNTAKITQNDVERKLNSMPDWKGIGPE